MSRTTGVVLEGLSDVRPPSAAAPSPVPSPGVLQQLGAAVALLANRVAAPDPEAPATEVPDPGAPYCGARDLGPPEPGLAFSLVPVGPATAAARGRGRRPPKRRHGGRAPGRGHGSRAGRGADSDGPSLLQQLADAAAMLADGGDASDLEAPDLGVPDPGVPHFGMPVPGAPNPRAPDLGAPQFEVPEPGVVYLEIPNLGAPYSRAPDLRAPYLGVAHPGAPQFEAHDPGPPYLGAPFPDPRVPYLGVPNSGGPYLEIHDPENRQLGIPDPGAHYFAASDIRAAHFGGPNPVAPKYEVPDPGAPANEAPDPEAPDSGAPQSGVPRCKVPDTGVPNPGGSEKLAPEPGLAFFLGPADTSLAAARGRGHPPKLHIGRHSTNVHDPGHPPNVHHGTGRTPGRPPKRKYGGRPAGRGRGRSRGSGGDDGAESLEPQVQLPQHPVADVGTHGADGAQVHPSSIGKFGEDSAPPLTTAEGVQNSQAAIEGWRTRMMPDNDEKRKGVHGDEHVPTTQDVIMLQQHSSVPQGLPSVRLPPAATPSPVPSPSLPQRLGLVVASQADRMAAPDLGAPDPPGPAAKAPDPSAPDLGPSKPGLAFSLGTADPLEAAAPGPDQPPKRRPGRPPKRKHTGGRKRRVDHEADSGTPLAQLPQDPGADDERPQPGTPDTDGAEVHPSSNEKSGDDSAPPLIPGVQNNPFFIGGGRTRMTPDSDEKRERARRRQRKKRLADLSRNPDRPPSRGRGCFYGRGRGRGVRPDHEAGCVEPRIPLPQGPGVDGTSVDTVEVHPAGTEEPANVPSVTPGVRSGSAVIGQGRTLALSSDSDD